MAHFADIDASNKVVRVLRVLDEDLTDEQGVEREHLGVNFLLNLGLQGNWMQTSYSGKFRRNFASLGGYYVPEKDEFSSPQPFPSWTFNMQIHDWEPPVARPEDGQEYCWNEAELCWLPVDSSESA